jgi:FG-GAP repeat
MRFLAEFLIVASMPSSLLFALPDKQVIAGDLAGGYQVIACDVNGDGKPDLLAVASGMTDLLWFENPKWERHIIASNLPHMINAACWQHGSDKTPTIALAYEFSMHAKQSLGTVCIFTANGDPRNPWKRGEIDRLPTSHRLRWADIDGSGNKVLINAPLTGALAEAPDFRGHVPLVFYRPGVWKRESIGDDEEGIQHGIFIDDWNHDGRDAILIGSFLGIHLYQNSAPGRWSRTEITKGDPAPWPKSGTSDVTVGTLNNERFVAAIEPWHGNEVVVYRHSAGAWRREVIDSTLLDGHTIAAADLNGDGQDEIVAGFRGKPYGIYIYRYDGHNWTRQVLEQGELAASGCTVADFDGGGKLAVGCIGSATHNLILYRNLSK